MLSVVISFIALISLGCYAYFSLAHFQKQLPFNDNVLILTAHPDDECMFFGPTLTSLKTLTKSRIHVLCLSTGNAEGLGNIRKKELIKSCQTFGIQTNQVKSLDRPELQDGMKNQWDPKVISDILNDFVTKHKINTIITFDHQGISQHINHIATYKGAKYFVEQHPDIKLFKLESISLIRKYIGILDLFVPSKAPRIQLISPPVAYLLTHKAMRQHETQLVWFRWLYVTFSRYMFINDLLQEQ